MASIVDAQRRLPESAHPRHRRCRQRDSVQTGKVEKEEDLNLKVGREERYRTVISGMEPRRIAVVMLLPRTGFWITPD